MRCYFPFYLAEHYGIQNIQGQHFRKVQLPEGSPRGSVLTHTAILKTKVAQGDVQTGEYVGRQLRAELKGGSEPNARTPFRYSVEGSLATIG